MRKGGREGGREGGRKLRHCPVCSALSLNIQHCCCNVPSSNICTFHTLHDLTLNSTSSTSSLPPLHPHTARTYTHIYHLHRHSHSLTNTLTNAHTIATIHRVKRSQLWVCSCLCMTQTPSCAVHRTDLYGCTTIPALTHCITDILHM